MKKKDILHKPIITEKSMFLREKGKYVFKVDKRANKNQIKEAIENLFDVEVEKIATMIMPGKTKRAGSRRRQVRDGIWKKAIIKLKKGDKLDIFEEG